jgi:CDP-diacylglycerol--serine O-phosphatidyltransferase
VTSTSGAAQHTPTPHGRPVVRYQDRRGIRRGVSLLPSLFTLGNLFCGWSCIVYTLHGRLDTASVFIGVAMVLDMLDGRIARMTGTSSEFGVQLDSLVDLISFGMAPAVLAYVWGLGPLGRIGWAVGFLFVTGAALRLARFNLQQGHTDKRYFVGLPSPAAAAILAATVFYASDRESTNSLGWIVYLVDVNFTPFIAVGVVVIPALLMVSTIRFQSFKTLDLRAKRRYTVLIALAAFVALVTAYPHQTLLVMAYGYLLSAFVGMAISKFRHRDHEITKGDTKTRNESS